MQALIEKAQAEIKESFNDDFNTPKAMASLFEVVRFFNQQVPQGVKKKAPVSYMSELFFQFIKNFGQPLALFQESPKDYLTLLDEMLLEQKGLDKAEINKLVEARTQARENKDYQESDRLRDQLVEMGIDLRDSAEGTVWEVRK